MIVITMARKPVVGSVASNVLKYGTGGLNIDGCRLGTRDNLNGGGYAKNPTPRAGLDMWTQNRKGDTNCMRRGGAGEYQQPPGRWPANIIFEHRPSCQKMGTQEIPGYIIHRFDDGAKLFGGGVGHPYTETVTDPGTADIWDCASDCPVRALDEQSGVTQSGAMKREVDAYAGESSTQFLRGRSGPSNQHGDSGGASRFFKQVEPDGERE